MCKICTLPVIIAKMNNSQICRCDVCDKFELITNISKQKIEHGTCGCPISIKHTHKICEDCIRQMKYCLICNKFSLIKVLWMEPGECRCLISKRHKHELCNKCLHEYTCILIHNSNNDSEVIERYLSKPDFWNKNNKN